LLVCTFGCGINVASKDEKAHEQVCSKQVILCSAAHVGYSYSNKHGLIHHHQSSCYSVQHTPILQLQKQ